MALHAQRSLWLLLVFAVQACATVKPWEREAFASPAMQSPDARDPTAQEYEDKVVRSQTGGALPSANAGAGAASSGCGCTQ